MKITVPLKNQVHKLFKLLKRYRKIVLSLLFLLGTLYWFALPAPLFDTPYSTVLEDRNGQLLGARISKDGQWRFPLMDSIPQKFEKALLEFEDHRFYYHPGIDFISLGRAMLQNIRNGRIVSGASTISMQVIRIARQNKSRTISEKLVEMILATRLELGYSKKEILKLYSAHAPFGGNVVGLEAASWRYFGKPPNLLSWAEATTLAVLPNSPALIHPGRNRSSLLEKRNRLLNRLLESQQIDSLSWELAKLEPLPEAPLPLPQLAPHLLDQVYIKHQAAPTNIELARVKSSLDIQHQIQVNDIIDRRHALLKNNHINNLAALIIEVESGEILAYVGNALAAGPEHGAQVDVIQAPRSTGSILKPFLYALAIQDGRILPSSVLPDIPIQISGYQPKNYSLEYDGIIPADRALSRSLNVPMVHLLQRYGLEKFHYKLKQLGVSTINKHPNHYGLTLILGGAEATLFDISSVYASMSRTLNHTYSKDGWYNTSDFRPSTFLSSNENPEAQWVKDPPVLSSSAIWHTFQAMQEVERPSSEGDWKRFNSSSQIAWKTGTSFGFRDAWAVGVTPKYVVGVWAGNADGEGRPGLVGIYSAAPTLFDIFKQLPTTPWFEPPYDEFAAIAICQQSGYRALSICPKDTLNIAASGLKAAACSHHKLIHLDSTQSWQVNSNCMSPGDMIHQARFILPAAQAHYYRIKDPSYQNLPPYHPSCIDESQANKNAQMQLIYPKEPTEIYVPKDLDGQLSRTVFEVAHQNPEATIHWHLDEQYLTSTTTFHTYEFNPSPGAHVLTLVDEYGTRLVQPFEIITRE